MKILSILIFHNQSTLPLPSGNSENRDRQNRCLLVNPNACVRFHDLALMIFSNPYNGFCIRIRVFWNCQNLNPGTSLPLRDSWICPQTHHNLTHCMLYLSLLYPLNCKNKCYIKKLTIRIL